MRSLSMQKTQLQGMPSKFLPGIGHALRGIQDATIFTRTGAWPSCLSSALTFAATSALAEFSSAALR